ncbi:MAG: ATP-dependent Clp protease proteolytic subunit [Pseudomonadota bacterium]
MQSQLKSLIATLAITLPFNAAAHNQEILDACPQLKPTLTVTMPSFFPFSELDIERSNKILGYIDEASAINAINNIREQNFEEQDTPADELEPALLVINSDGGRIGPSRQIMTQMALTSSIVTLCTEEASSAAMLILAQSESSFSLRQCFSLIHKPVYDHEAESKYHELARENTAREIKDHTLSVSNMSSECYDTLTQNDGYILSATDMLKFEIVDALLDENLERMTVLAEQPNAPKYKIASAQTPVASPD